MGKVQVLKITDDKTGKDLPEELACEVKLTMVIRRPATDDDETSESDTITTGEQWELVYAAETVAELRKVLIPFLKNVTPVDPLSARSPSTSGGSGKTPSNEARLTHARAWWAALTEGQRVDGGKLVGVAKLPEPKTRGRIPAEVYAAYDATKPEGHVPE